MWRWCYLMPKIQIESGVRECDPLHRHAAKFSFQRTNRHNCAFDFRDFLFKNAWQFRGLMPSGQVSRRDRQTLNWKRSSVVMSA